MIRVDIKPQLLSWARERAGLGTDALARRFPKAPGWTDFERTLLRMVDELRYDAMVSTATWSALRKEYSDQKMMEALYTAAQYQLVSMALNSLGVQSDPDLRHRLPSDVPLPKLAGHATGARLKTPRIPPLRPEQWTPEQREMIAPQKRPDGLAINSFGIQTEPGYPGFPQSSKKSGKAQAASRVTAHKVKE